MAWPAEAGALLNLPNGSESRRRSRSRHREELFLPPLPRKRVLILAPEPRRKKKRRRRWQQPVLPPLVEHKFGGEMRGLYRIFNATLFEIWHSASGPPLETDAPTWSPATLPFTGTGALADGAHYFSMARFNGVIKSGFLPLGPNGETYLRFDLSGGVIVGSPPRGADQWNLVVTGPGVVRVTGVYFEIGDLRADDWALSYTSDGSTPLVLPTVGSGTTNAFKTMPTGGLATLVFDITGVGGATVKARLQTRRFDGGDWFYSEGSIVKEIDADNVGGIAGGADTFFETAWPGRLAETI